MEKQHQLLAIALLTCSFCHAKVFQDYVPKDSIDTEGEAEFSFNESQLDENEDITSEIIQVGSATNVYTNQIGYTWGGSMRFKFRALDNRYNDVYMNGVSVNNAENGRFSYSTIGGMNDAVRNKDNSNPFEDNKYSMSAIGGSANYDLRAGSMPVGHKVTLSGANRNYTTRAMYSYGSGFNKNGWAWFGTVGYRWANMETAYVKGTFYNSLSYFLSLQKQWDEGRSFNIASWGSPTERAGQGSTTDEARWLANDYQYNPNWGYQNGKKRSSRVINNYEPSLLATLDWKFNDKVKAVVSGFVKYAKYSSTNLNYNDAQNPNPDYWKNMPSSKFNPWKDHLRNNEYGYAEFWDAYAMWQTEEGRQIKWDELYAKNRGRNNEGRDAAYYVGKRHNDHFVTNLATTFNININKERKLDFGVQLGRDKAMHYQTVADLMGAYYLYNVNSYAIGNYTLSDPQVWYDYNRFQPGDTEPYTASNRLYEGDRYGYDYDIYTQNVKGWMSYSVSKGISHSFLTGYVGGTQMWRDGHMRNGIYLDNSYGKSGVGTFLDGGFKLGSTLNIGKGNVIAFGLGYECAAPKAYSAFTAPELNNNFATDFTDTKGNITFKQDTEKHISAELGYALNNSWLRLNLNGYYYYMYDMIEHSNYFDDELNSFSYNTLYNVNKRYYGVELGAKFKITNHLDIVALATYSEAEYVDNANYHWEMSIPSVLPTAILQEKNPNNVLCYSDGIHEGSTPLSAYSLGINYRLKGWYLNLTGNYFDRIYLSFAPNQYLESTLEADRHEQTKGHGGFMLDASIGRQFKIAKRPLSVNLQLCNLTNTRNITTGGFEQSRGNTPRIANGSPGDERIYDFSKNPRKYYAQGFNFMLNLNYRF